jgi:hypothetical protein
VNLADLASFWSRSPFSSALIPFSHFEQDWHPGDHISFHSKLDKSRVHPTEVEKLKSAKLFDEVWPEKEAL